MAIPQAQKRFIKVETPVTTDGRTLAYDENRQPMVRTSYLPITAKTELLRNTSKLPEYLRPKITEMSGDPDAQKDFIEDQRQAQEDIAAESEQPVKVAKTRKRTPKAK